MRAAGVVGLVGSGLAALFAVGANAAETSKPAPAPAPVTAGNFIRAESDLYFARIVKEGGFGRFNHRRAPASIANQTVVRLNRDTLYSSVVLDLDAGTATVTLPDAGDRFMSIMAVNQDHYVKSVAYGGGRYNFTRRKAGTRYLLVGVRTLVNPTDHRDLDEVHRLQDAMTIEQEGGPGRFEMPHWDPVSQKKVRDALLALGSTVPDFSHSFGAEGDVDPVRHLIATATGWGGNPDKDAFYLNVTPPKNDGVTKYRLTVGEVPVDAFWSISLYNAKGYFVANKLNAYSLNSITAKQGDDGAVTVQFGGCDGRVANCLPIMPGWNYTVRLYRPRPEILDGTWTFPAPERLR